MIVVRFILLWLPVLVVAQDQVPLVDQVKGWFGKAQSYVQSAVPPAVTNPIDTAASKVAATSVSPVTLDNWRDVLKPSTSAKGTEPQEWMVYVTGANKTCYGLCGRADAAWNESTALLGSTPNAPQLGLLNCEESPVLCNAWAIGPPMIIHAFLPRPLPDQSTPATTVRFIGLNRTAVAASDIWEMASSGKGTYRETDPYEGYFHPFDSFLAHQGLNIYLGTFIYYVAMVPSWAFMIAISFFSRSFMSRRMGPDRPLRQGQSAGQAAPASQ
ncbi:MAG: hypothetical protein M1821_003632 [Bathelium mastoideum]|nr:MAG: hypothetical protein M1821_003632 [Bathelium mastoideum]KAI9684920.1 MAG: hypothetical protein M1822_005569 [Bathelium mastoideum]